MAVWKLLDGNHAAAWGARLSRAQVIPIYPITPQTELATTLAEWIDTGEYKAEYVTTASEHEVMGICGGASAAGARVFTSSASQGIVFMEEHIWIVAGQRLPIVMGIVNRAIANPGSLRSDQNDSLLQRDAGWLQFYCEDAQEVIDTCFQMYKIAENKDVLLPAIFTWEGYVVGHTAMPVNVPDQKDIDDFLPPYKNERTFLDPERFVYDPVMRAADDEGPLLAGTEAVYQMTLAMNNAKKLAVEVNADYGKRFGRSYGDGLIETYKSEDAEALLVAVGSTVGTARYVVDKFRAQGKRIGLVKIKAFRPFPTEELKNALKNARAIGVIDKNRSPGSAFGGIFNMEVASALYQLKERPLLSNYFLGLVGADVFIRDIEKVANKTLESAETGRVDTPVTWVQRVEKK